VAESSDGGTAAVAWSRAWARAAYGPGGFFTTGPGATGGPAAHFRTSVHVGAAFARAIAELVDEVDARLGRPPRLEVVDVGAGRGELLAGLLAACDADLVERLAPIAVEVRPRPYGLDPRIAWAQTVAGPLDPEGTGAAPHPSDLPADVRGLILLHEVLDDVPLDVVEVDDVGVVRLVLVTADGVEERGPELTDAHDLAWLTRWWPVSLPGERAEIGRPRDDLWAAWVQRLAAGTAVAVDYGHVLGRRHPPGTLTAYRGGRVVAAVPDGSANLTAHVALDSLADRVGGEVTTQREALLALGVRSRLPERGLAERDPVAYADALVEAADTAELLDPSGLGAFGWVRVDR